MRHVVMFSGGIGSWACAKRVADQHGPENVTLLFADVKGDNPDPHVGEDEDTYRFIEDAAANVGAELVRVADGRDIWQVFKDRRFLGNSRQANCSTELKQKPARRWLEANYQPGEAIVYVGIDWTEMHRLPAIKRAYLPYQAEAPMTEAPYMDKQGMIDWAKREGVTPPRLYSLGFSHNNCGGGCVRAGQGQFKRLLELMPERFDRWAQGEAEVAGFLGKDVSILSETQEGNKRNLPLVVLRDRHQADPGLLDSFDIGGCGCFTEWENAE